MPTERFTPKMEAEQIMRMSSLALAHVGDAVFELLVRTQLACAGSETAAHLHSAATARVNASAQAEDVKRMLPFLTEEEEGVFKRGRNAKVNSVPKNANVGDYHEATGLEALFGYLYLMGRTERIRELYARIAEDEANGT